MAMDRLSTKAPWLRMTLSDTEYRGEGGDWGPLPGSVSRVPRGAIEPDRLRLILHRLATDFYESAEVRDRIAGALRVPGDGGA